MRFLTSLFVICSCAPLFSNEAVSADVTFERDVRPILKAYCFHCHGEDGVTEGGLDVRLRRFLVKGGDSGPAIEPNDLDSSYLLDRIRNGEMPPGEGGHLTESDIATLERWVAAGAPTARPEPETIGDGPIITEEERSHWAFQPVQRPAVPAETGDEVRTPIDAFLLARLKSAGLTYSSEAAKRTLLRRVMFDLVGLPPTPAEVEAFVTDERPDAYERLVDRLLASPRYGERWGRHWLDIAGYADSEGYNDADTIRLHAFRYRDYVIRSFNEDKPFDRFIREQLAGDELLTPPYKNLSDEQAELLAATGFLRMVPDGTGGRNDDPEAAKQAVVAETIKVVSSSLLGLTVGCAECHDHRYDPIPQRDYYRLRAVFEPALDPKNWLVPARRRVSLLTDAEREQANAIEVEAKAIEAELKVVLEEYRDWVFEQEVAKIPEADRVAAREAGLAWRADQKKVTEEQKRLVETYPGVKVSASVGILNLFLENYGKAAELKKAIEENAARAAAVRARKPREEFIRALTETPGRVPTTFVFHRGDRNSPRGSVPPGDLSVLSADPVDLPLDDPSLPTTGRRLRFAQELTDGSHPLVPRVIVNRLWMHHFGRGLVGSTGDFGLQGEAPTHPELLDWMAIEFVSSGWSVKAIHRLIVNSTAYRQSSARMERGEMVDADNKLYWRMPVRRLEAEAIRDSMLAVAGDLEPSMYGPPTPVVLDSAGQSVVGDDDAALDPGEGRRSVYVQIRRSTPAYLLDAFDAPQMEPNCEARGSSTVAPQSLLMMNSGFVIAEANRFAKAVTAHAGADPREQARTAWKRAFAEEPSEQDLENLTHYLDAQTKLLAARKPATKDAPPDPAQQALASLCQILFGSNQFLYVP